MRHALLLLGFALVIGALVWPLLHRVPLSTGMCCLSIISRGDFGPSSAGCVRLDGTQTIACVGAPGIACRSDDVGPGLELCVEGQNDPVTDA